MAETPEAAPIVGADGTLSPTWRESLPEDIRGEKCLDVVSDFPTAMKSYVSAQRLVGRDKVALPTDKSTPEEWDNFYGAIGRPKTADDYKINVPEDLQEIFTNEMVADLRKNAHALGATQKQVDGYVKTLVDTMNRMHSAQEETEAKEKADAEKVLRQEFGGAYDERIHMSNLLIAETFSDPEEKMLFLERYGNDPAFIRFASKVGARLVESKGLIAKLTIDTPGDAKKKIAELEATPGYYDGRVTLSQAERDEISRKLRELYKTAYPVAGARKATTGSVG